MSKVSSGCCCSHYHIIRKVSNTLAGSALPLPPLTRSGRSSDSFQPTDYHTCPAAAATASVTFDPTECPSDAYGDDEAGEPDYRAYSYDIAEEELDDEPDNVVGRCALAAPIWYPLQTDSPAAISVAVARNKRL